ncbi:uncharacterized protein [Engystomops pustulosus]|uniref:uncharacterized protein isoform X1 n=1 Tax=Engystomops pustulosus TaxID=76066 RepID=UPI003AFB5F9A
MGEDNIKSLGKRYCKKWLQNRILLSSPTKILPPILIISFYTGHHLAGGPESATTGGHPESSAQSEGTRFLLSSVHSEKAQRIESSYNKLERTKSLHNIQTFQDGVGKICYTPHPPKLLYVHHRLKGRLLPRSHPPFLSEIFKIFCSFSGRGNSPLSVLRTTLRNIFRSQGIFQTDDRGGGFLKKPGCVYRSLSRRLPDYSQYQLRPNQVSGLYDFYTHKSGVDRQLSEVKSFSPYPDKIFGGNLRLMSPNLFSSTGQEGQHQTPRIIIQEKTIRLNPNGDEAFGADDSQYPSSFLVPKPFQIPPKLDSLILGQITKRVREKGPDPAERQTRSSVVAGYKELRKGRPMDPTALDYHSNRCKQVRLGRLFSRSTGTGSMDSRNQCQILQLQRIVCSLGNSEIQQVSPKEFSPPDIIRQHHHCIISEETGGNQISGVTGTITENLQMGREQLPISLRNLSSWKREPNSRLLEQESTITKRMVSKAGDLQPSDHLMGATSHRPLCFKREYKMQPFLFSRHKGTILDSGRIQPYLGPATSICLSPNSPDFKSTTQGLPGQGQGNTNLPELEEEELVPSSEIHGSSGTHPTSSRERSPISRPSSSSKTELLRPISMDPERELLLRKGLSSRVVNTLQASRKPVTFAIYHKIWKKFVSFCGDKPPSQDNPNIFQVLEFLQAGLERGLSTSTLKVQVSALGAFHDCCLMDNRWVKRFITASSRIHPQVLTKIPTWDLTLVLNTLSKGPFEPVENIDIRNLTLKTVFLVAITSARRLGELQAISIQEPYLKILDDRIIITLDSAFLPKVVSNFHRNQEIILPSFCSNPTSSREAEWHTLDGPNKGKKASKITIARWLKMAISKCYNLQNKPVPLNIKAHSTRAMSTSWAERRGATLDQICRAATWASQNTFIKHYRLDIPKNKDLAFGRKVLQSVIPP